MRFVSSLRPCISQVPHTPVSHSSSTITESTMTWSWGTTSPMRRYMRFCCHPQPRLANVSTSRWKTFQRLTGAQQTMTHHDMKNGAISMQMSGIRWLSSVPLRAAIRPGQLLAISQSSLSDNTPHLVDTTGDPHRECPPASSAVT